MSEWITIIDVMRELKLECHPNVTWVVGAQVRDLYEDMTGHLPTKVLRQKTKGIGSHCFAIYPSSMRRDIERIILAHVVEAARQGEFQF